MFNKDQMIYLTGDSDIDFEEIIDDKYVILVNDFIQILKSLILSE